MDFAVCYLNAIIYAVFSSDSHGNAFAYYTQADGWGGGSGGDGNDLCLDGDDSRSP